MKLAIISKGGSKVTVEDMQGESLMLLLEALDNPAIHFLAISLDGTAMTYIAKANVVRIDID